jgi:hypothetical protein
MPANTLRTRNLLIATALVLAADVRAQDEAAPAADARLPAVPRYRFQPGEALEYERLAEIAPLAGGGPTRSRQDRIRVWCLEQRGTEWLLLLQLTTIRQDRLELSRGTPVYIDERGRCRVPPEMLARLDELDPAFEILPELRPALGVSEEWKTQPDPFNRVWRCRPVSTSSLPPTLTVPLEPVRPAAPTEAADSRPSSAPGQRASGPEDPRPIVERYEFEEIDDSGAMEVLGLSRRGEFWFDRQSACVQRVAVRTVDPPSGLAVRSETTLRQRLTRDELWCRRRIDEIQRWIRAIRSEERLLNLLLTEPGSAVHSLRRAGRIWTELTTELNVNEGSPLRAIALGDQVWLVQRSPVLLERARMAARWGGGVAAHWSLQDLDGKPVTSESLRSRPCLECFWTSDSLACLRTMETLRALRRRLPEEGLNIVCLNMDADLAAARNAIILAGSGLTHVLSGPPVGGKVPRELPILRLLDRNSRILRIWVGWQPSLVDEVIPLIR